VLTAVLLLVAPPHYHRGPRPIVDGINRLQPVGGELRTTDDGLIASRNWGICAYLATRHTRHCSALNWQEVRAQVAGGRTLAEALRSAKATVVYADPGLERDPLIATLVASPQSFGWREIANGVASDGPWAVLVRADQA
jgi:hypothetical protein